MPSSMTKRYVPEGEPWMFRLTYNSLVGVAATGSDQRVRGKQMENDWAEGWEACEGGHFMDQLVESNG